MVRSINSDLLLFSTDLCLAVPDAGQGRIPEWSANPAGAQAGHQQADRRRARIDRRGDVDLAVF